LNVVQSGFFVAEKFILKTHAGVWQFRNSHRISGERGKHHPPLAKRKGVNM
jgi:hypothetical protein